MKNKWLYEKKHLLIPSFLHIEVTEYCPLKCPQCYCQVNCHQEMQYNKLCDLVYQAKGLGVKRILLTGGEPLYYSKIVEAVSLIANSGMLAEISSSGIGLTEELAIHLSKNLHILHLSLNGSKEDIHNISRSHFDQTVRSLRIAKKNGLKYGINWVARHDNVYDFPNLTDLVFSENASFITILSNKPDGNGILQSPLLKNDFEYLVKVASTNYEKGEILIDICYPSLREALNKRKDPPLLKKCTAGKVFFDVLVDGKLCPCRHMQTYNPVSEKLSSFWETNELLQNLRINESNKEGCIYEN